MARRLDPRSDYQLSEAERGARQAEAYIDDIRTAIERVAATPDRGQACGEIRAGYWVYPTGRHLIFYVLHDPGIDIIRIIHERMDPTRHV